MNSHGGNLNYQGGNLNYHGGISSLPTAASSQRGGGLSGVILGLFESFKVSKFQNKSFKMSYRESFKVSKFQVSNVL